jgi:hypothetical protein
MRAFVLLGANLARRGFLGKASIVIAALTTIIAVVFAIVLATRGDAIATSDMPVICASALAWGAGVLIAFAAAAQSMVRDRDEGIAFLLAYRGASLRDHLVARAFGLAALLIIVLGGGTLLCGVACIASTSQLGVASRTIHTTFASCTYIVAFAIVIAPLSLAALGARSRAGGYGWIVAILFLPEMISPFTSTLVPFAWRETVSIPAALATLRASLMPDVVDLSRGARALLILAIASAFCFLLARREFTHLRAERS